MTSPPFGWIAYTKTKAQPRLRLFCLPYAGGGASMFRTWADCLPLEVQLCSIQLPGREDRFSERPYTQLAPLVEALADALFPYLKHPFALFGHSMGALISFEFARHIRREYALQPVHLFVSGCRAPHVPNRLPPIHQLPQAEFVAELSRLNPVPEAVLTNPELLELLLPTLRADFAIYERYTYATESSRLDCPISVFEGLHDNLVCNEDLAAWREQTHAACSFRSFPGDHFFVHTARRHVVRAVSQDLTRRLAALDPMPSSQSKCEQIGAAS